MKFFFIFAIYAIMVSFEFAQGLPSEERTSSILMNNGVVLSGLEWKESHPLINFSKFERDSRCSGVCACTNGSCDCNCYSCTISQCVAGCLVAC